MADSTKPDPIKDAHEEDALLLREYGWLLKIITKAWDDDDFSAQLAQDPKNAISELFPNLPFDFSKKTVNVYFDDDDTINISIPSISALKERGY